MPCSNCEENNLCLLHELEEDIRFSDTLTPEGSFYPSQPQCVDHIRNLPPEILSMIFKHCALQEPNKEDCFAPRKLTSVNQCWRDVVTSDPAFWTHISIKMTPKSLENTESLIFFLRCCLERARGRDVCLHIVCEDTANTLTLEAHPYTKILRFVRYYHDSWSELRLVLPLAAFQRTSIASTFPRLRTLHIGYYGEITGSMRALMGIVSAAPLLRSFSMGVPVGLSPPTLPWAQITRLTLECGNQFLSYAPSLEVLLWTPNLEVLRILSTNNADIEHLRQPTSASVNLRKLTVLEAFGCSDQDGNPFVSGLRSSTIVAPALRTLVTPRVRKCALYSSNWIRGSDQLENLTIPLWFFDTYMEWLDNNLVHIPRAWSNLLPMRDMSQKRSRPSVGTRGNRQCQEYYIHSHSFKKQACDVHGRAQ
ncbi:hypothetical protein DL96DRAFT_1605654 [Flagelloscypha sp. PMI_526]|nr:hypothetical protein DL96DRAFT_1605654 [Flagelloscypha sp. PMI_526]